MSWFPSPFARAVHPLVRDAAADLQAWLSEHGAGLGLDADGKMFGVLVVDDGPPLWAFSGMLDGRWDHDGFAPPLFDAAVRDAVWLDGEREMRARAAEIEAAEPGERKALQQARAARSRELLVQIQEAYAFVSARGERRTLRELFAPAEPPGMAGNCAGPKLLAEAYRRGLRPLAMAEMWWGAPPKTGGRHSGSFYPACRGSCGPILTHMLDGLEVEPAPQYGGGPIPADEPRVVYEDEWLIVVDKPVGLLSVPGRHGALKDSVQLRMRARHGEAHVVHRLDLDTSGLMIVAKDEPTFIAMQRSFSRREIDKRYVAWLDGEVAGEAGEIELPLRVDLDDRPRQIVDPVHGKPALTRWRVIERAGGRTRVAFTPLTGRTHQLRVHAVVGLGAPIAGDRLYGHDGERLLLHAEALAFTHPVTGAAIFVERPAPF